MSSKATRSDPRPVSPFSLYATEEAVLDKSEVMLSRLEEVAGGVKDLAEAYRRSYREQRQLVRMSDRMQFDLQSAVHRLADQARELQELNEKLSAEIEHRSALEAELRRLAETDQLTGALSRRRFIELAGTEWRRQAQTGSAACLLMLDLDRFKSINDAYGHAAGDDALVSFGAACRAEIRALDLIGRVGGEEFAVVLPDTSLDQAQETAERLRSAVSATRLRSDAGRFSLSVSIGVAQGVPGENLEETMSRADMALYRAKHAGRNRVHVCPPDIRQGSAAA